MDLTQFDADGDGKLTKEELPEQMRAFFDRMDTNSDGAIDAAERAAARARRQAAEGGSQSGPGAPSGGGEAGAATEHTPAGASDTAVGGGGGAGAAAPAPADQSSGVQP
jgi:collagen type III alpha